MSKVWVRNTKTGEERPMTQKSLDYQIKKGRGFEFVRKIEEPKSEIQQHMERLRAEKSAQTAGQESLPPTFTQQPTTTKAKPGPKPKIQTA